MNTKQPAAGRIIIAGGSRFLGVSLAAHLAESGASVVILSRHATPGSGGM